MKSYVKIKCSCGKQIQYEINPIRFNDYVFDFDCLDVSEIELLILFSETKKLNVICECWKLIHEIIYDLYCETYIKNER